jgi:hypothetical protein
MACIAKLKGCWVGCGRSTVIPRCAIVHLRARLLARARNPLHIHTAARWIPGSRYARSGMTAGYASAISRRVSPEACHQNSFTLQSEGAGKAGCALHPRSRVQNCRGRRHTSIQVKRRHPTFPAQWFKAYTCSPRRSGFACHRRQRKVFASRRLDANPEAVRPTRFRPSAQAALVSRNSRVHRISPRVRDDRDPPLSSGETGAI